MTRRFVLGAAVLGLVAGGAGRSDADIVTFTDRTAFNAAANPNGSENFNSFVADTSFRNTSVAIANGTVTGQPGSGGSLTNMIDVAPFLSGGFYAPDMTPYLLGDLANNQAITFALTAPVTAWGADFRDVGNPGRAPRIDVFDASDVLLGSVDLSGGGSGQLRFFGFTVTGSSASRIVLTNPTAVNEVFGADNIAFTTASAAVPEASTLAMSGLVTMAGLSYGWRRRRAAA